MIGREPNWDSIADQKLNAYLDECSRMESLWESFVESEEATEAELVWKASNDGDFFSSSECDSIFEEWAERAQRDAEDAWAERIAEDREWEDRYW